MGPTVQPGGRLPLDAHRQPGIARVEPIAVPAGRCAHQDCKLDLASRNGARFGDELRLDGILPRDLRRGGRGNGEQ